MESELLMSGGGGVQKDKVARKETPTDSEIKRRPMNGCLTLSGRAVAAHAMSAGM